MQVKVPEKFSMNQLEEDKIYKDHQEKFGPDSPSKKAIKNVSRTQFILIFITGLLGMYFVLNHTLPYLFAIIMFLAVILAIYFGAMKLKDDLEPLDFRTLAIILHKEIEWMQNSYTEIFPRGLIEICPTSNNPKIDGKLDNWRIKFIIHAFSGEVKIWTAVMTPYKGKLRGFEERPEGFTGREKPYIRSILPRDMQYLLKYGKPFVSTMTREDKR